MRLRFLLPLLALLFAATPATADAEVRMAANQLTDAQLDAYWTPERIAHAKPVPVPEPVVAAVPSPDGPALAVPGRPGTTRGVYETTGRLLFSQNGGDWICSATVVASNNASVIATARHCGFNGTVGSNFRFAPSYNAGNAPHGWWNWRSAGWASGGSWSQQWQAAGWSYQTGTFFGSYGSAAAGSYYGSLAHDIWNGAQNA